MITARSVVSMYRLRALIRRWLRLETPEERMVRRRGTWAADVNRGLEAQLEVIRRLEPALDKAMTEMEKQRLSKP
jgi:hypothetical protein